MEITIKGTPEEVKELLQAIESSMEQRVTSCTKIDARELARSVLPSIHGKARQGSER